MSSTPKDTPNRFKLMTGQELIEFTAKFEEWYHQLTENDKREMLFRVYQQEHRD